MYLKHAMLAVGSCACVYKEYMGACVLTVVKFVLAGVMWVARCFIPRYVGSLGFDVTVCCNLALFSSEPSATLHVLLAATLDFALTTVWGDSMSTSHLWLTVLADRVCQPVGRTIHVGNDSASYSAMNVCGYTTAPGLCGRGGQEVVEVDIGTNNVWSCAVCTGAGISV